MVSEPVALKAQAHRVAAQMCSGTGVSQHRCALAHMYIDRCALVQV